MKDAFSESKIDNGDLGRFGIVMPSKLTASEQLRSERSEKLRRNLIIDNVDAVGGPQVRFIRRINRCVGLVNAERHGVGVRGRLHPVQLLNGFECLPLEGAAAFLGISGEAQLERRRGNALRLETEVHLQRLLETAQRKERRRDKHKANRHLYRDQ